MKKITLFTTALLSVFCLQSQAQTNPTWDIVDTVQTTVVDPNVTFTVPSDDYLDVTKAWIPSDSAGDRTKADDSGIYQFDNMRNGQIAVFHLNVTSAVKAKINMQMATKLDAGVELALFDADHNLEMDQVLTATNTGSWTKFADNYAITDKAITTGEKTLVIIFNGPKNTVNVRQVQWTEFANQNTYSFYPNVVSDDNNPDAGTITVSPSVNTYIEGTEITVTATAAEGYKFINWTNVDGDVVSTTNTYTFSIYEDTDLDANFKKINMVNTIPGFIDLDTRITSYGSLTLTDATASKTPRYITDYENQENADTFTVKSGIPYLGDFRDGQFFYVKVQVQEQAKYYINFLASSKQEAPQIDVVFINEDNTTADSVTISIPSTGQWYNYTKVQAETNVEIPTTVNKVVVYFRESVANKYTASLMNLSITSAAQDPTLDAEGNSILINGTTGIEGIKTEDSATSNARYNLSGQRVDENYKGVVIINGKKYIAK